jgi:gamma-glutamylcyclotransferase (GGCT)/AIG2-like uncharacterized protein YtfP
MGEQSSPVLMCKLVFVYGTLKRGQANHQWLEGASFAGETQLAGATLYDMGPFPMVIAAAAFSSPDSSPDSATPGGVHGEVYVIDGPALERLDRLEGYPRLYDRRVLFLADGRRAWVYLGRPRQVRHAPRLASGYWPEPLLVLLPLAWLLLSAGLAWPPARADGARVDDSRSDCLAWQRSHGEMRIRRGNAIGTTHYLTKMKRLQVSPDQAPVALYAESDLLRVCGERR